MSVSKNVIPAEAGIQCIPVIPVETGIHFPLSFLRKQESRLVPAEAGIQN